MGREELGADDNGLLGKTTLAENLEVARVSDIDHRDRAALLPVLTDTLGNKSPELVQIDARAVVLRVKEVEVTHAVLAEVARVVSVEKSTVMVLTTSVTTTSRVLTCLDDTTMTHLHVATQLSSLPASSSHLLLWMIRIYTNNKQKKNNKTNQKKKKKKKKKKKTKKNKKKIKIKIKMIK